MTRIQTFYLGKMLSIWLLVLGTVLVSSAQNVTDEKLTAEVILTKHLQSIGTDEARNGLRSLTAVGSAKATFFGRGGGVAEGIAVLASKGDKYMVGMKFNTSDYPFEKMGFDGNDFSVGFVRPGVRSTLGSFLRTNKNSFKAGIMSGSLATAWALLRYDSKIAKLRYSGTKKIDGKKLLAIDYSPKKGSDLDITLFFDPETFHHVRTEYKRVLTARQGANVDASAGQSETRYTMVEDFSEFREESRITLPHSYKISLEILTGNGTTSYEWVINLQRFTFNSDIDDKEFKVDSY